MKAKLNRESAKLGKVKLKEDLQKEENAYELEYLSLLVEAEAQRKIPHFLNNVLTLMEINAKIWVLEASMRASNPEDPCAQEKLDMSEVGTRALRIRDLNAVRVAAKVSIDKMFGACPDEKVDHASVKNQNEDYVPPRIP
jgi:hypothetical protein